MDKLIREVTAEKEHIEKTMLALSSTMSRPEKTIIETAAIGTFLHNIYSGMENILKRVLKFEGSTIAHTGTASERALEMAQVVRESI